MTSAPWARSRSVDQQRPGRYPAFHGLPHARRAGLAVAADDRDRVLVDVDGDAGAQLLTGKAALARLPVALGEVGVADVGLFDPDGFAQHGPVLVAGYRDEHAVALLEGRLVGDAAQLGRVLDGDAVAHECVSSRGFEQKEHRKLSSLSIGSAHAF